jgi:hypothetical protein
MLKQLSDYTHEARRFAIFQQVGMTVVGYPHIWALFTITAGV